MVRRFSDLFKAMKPISQDDKEHLRVLKEYVSKAVFEQTKSYVKQRKIGLTFTDLGVTKGLVTDEAYPLLQLGTDDADVAKFAERVNGEVIEKVKERAYAEFAAKVVNELPNYIAHSIEGFHSVKDALGLQLFSNERVHILLLGDPGTGKTAMLHSAADLAPISSTGLGSGTSGVGLVASFDGKVMEKGLLPMADEGICAIDELNLMKQKDYAGLYNAMENGYVSYDKSDKHVKLDARVRILATANPTGDKFVGRGAEILRKQLPFDSALLTRFHLVFLIRKPNLEQFRQITKKIVTGDMSKPNPADIKFIREYISHAEKIETVDFPGSLQKQVVDFAEELKGNEKKFLIEISPRLIVGIVRLAKASARQQLRNLVEQKDLDRVLEIVRTSLFVRE
jgi:replicative DNA helicase Mcm